MGRARRVAVMIAVTMVVTVVDQVSKVIAHASLEGREPIRLLGGVVRLLYVENKGAFLSAGSSMPEPFRSALFLFAVPALMAILAVYAAVGRGVGSLEVLAASLVTAGGIGNLIDRLRFGHVRDFMLVGIGPVRTGVFNAADVAITAGALLLALAFVADRRRARRSAGETPSGPRSRGGRIVG